MGCMTFMGGSLKDSINVVDSAVEGAQKTECDSTLSKATDSIKEKLGTSLDLWMPKSRLR